MSQVDATRNDRYIERQIDRTGWQLRLQDLVAGVMLLAAGTIGILACAILVDHWLVSLNGWARMTTLLVMFACWGYLGWSHIAPAVFRRINPVFSAQTIEAGSPQLKNSLVNYLFLRRQRDAVRSVVYEEVRQRAATDLTTVSMATAVDRSHLIRVGYLLATMVVFAGLYQLVSPKDPWQTVRRVVAPWRDIARPSRVAISNIRVDDTLLEGNSSVTVFRGQHVRVSAVIRGSRQEEPTVLVYRTNDESWGGEHVVMRPVDSLGNCACQFPQRNDGLQQNVTFRIESGDAVSREYQLNLSTAPFISVESVSYVFPSYTARDVIVAVDQGDIRGLEGTRVTVHARANQPIQSAYVHFLSAAGQRTSDSARKYLRMQVTGEQAQTSFTLTLEPGQRAMQRGSYELRFTNGRDEPSQRPVQHLLEVVPDLDPTIEVLTPQKSVIEVAENSRQKIEIVARDPDFGLRRVDLRMVADGESIQTVTLLDDDAGWKGAARRDAMFIPQEHGLRAGQTVTYWAVARDNRTDARTGSLAPNVARTEEFVIKIGPPDGGNARRENARKDKEGQSASAREDQDPIADQPRSDDGGKQPTDEGSGQTSQGTNDSADQSEAGAADEANTESTDSADEGSTDGGRNGQKGGGPNSEGAPPSEDGGQSGGPSQPSHEKSSPEDGNRADAASNESQSRPNDGTEDGPVFEKILKQIKESQGGESGEAKSEKPSEPTDESAGTAAGSDTNEDQNPAIEQPSDSSPGEGDGSDPSRESTEKPADKEPQADANLESPPGLGDDRSPDAGHDKDLGQKDSGKGAPATQGENQQHPKSPTLGDDRQPESPSDSQSPSTSKRPSDSKGDERGDGGEGGRDGDGQQTDQPGSDGAGKNSAVDEDDGTAREPGKGEHSGRADQDQTSRGKTGQAATEKRPGTETKDPTGQNPTGSEDAGDADSTSDLSNGGPGDQGEPDPNVLGSPGSHSTADNPTSGGLPGTKNGQAATGPPGQEPGGDEANLEFAEEATDLALRYLREQQDNPDRALLDDLGWTEGDLRRFQQRWERLRNEARQDTPTGRTARNELTDRLKSLGLQPPRTRMRRGSSRDDDPGGLSDGGQRSQPPAEYRELFEAFQKSTAVD